MKNLSVKQLVLLGLGVVVVVFVATYARTYIGATAKPAVSRTTGMPSRQLAFTSVAWPEDAEAAAPDYELHVPGHHAFWFKNESDKPVQVSLFSKTCKCTKVEICTLPQEMEGFPREELDRRAEDPGLSWKTVEKVEDGKWSTVPPHSAGGVRLNWKGESLGPKALAADLQTESGGVPGEQVRLEARVSFVPTLRVNPEDSLKTDLPNNEISVDNLEERSVKSVTLLCWSSTRDDFDLKVEPKLPDDPCATAGKPEKLSKQECERLGKRDGKQVRCAFRVPFTVAERTAAGRQFDLGHFRRFFKLSATEEGIEPLTVCISGVVRGEITVQGKDSKGRPVSDRVALDSFDRSEGTSADVALTTENSKLDLEVESHPDFLTVQLQESGGQLIGKAWTMHVVIPPDSDFVGVIPHGTDIVLKTKGDKPRRIRIPVSGNAYVK